MKDVVTRAAGDRAFRDRWKIFAPAILLTLVGFVIAYSFMAPAPPRHIEIASGGPEGAYFMFAGRYREALAREGITLTVRPTSGSVENLGLLGDQASGVDVAFVQSGVGALADGSTAAGLRSLASLYFEPLWLFSRGGRPPARLTDLAGRRVAIGGAGSGTRAVVEQLLADNGITGPPTVLLPLGGQQAADALSRGEVDAAFFVASPKAPVVRALLRAEGIVPMSFARAEAYTRVHGFLSRVTLPEGAIDFAANIPARDIALLAPTANLVARAELHPALTALLLQTATEINGAGGLFEKPGQFPAPLYLDFPLDEAARRYFKDGPPFLQRYLPFWAANLIDRLKIMLLPLVTLLFPLFKIVPPTYRWRVRSRIYRWYRELQAVEGRLRAAASKQELGELRAELERIDDEVARVSVPLSYADALYHLRQHIRFVRDKLDSDRAAPPA